MPIPAHIERLPRYMSQAEVSTFFRPISDPRDRALFALVYLYGLRVSELELLTREDVDLERGRIVVKRVKGGVWTERPLFSSADALLRQFLTSDAASDVDDQPLFPGKVGPLRKRQVQSRFTRYRDAAGLDGRYTCHSLRHSIATHLLDAGLPMEFVQDHLGHRSIRSTTIYARVSDRRRQRIFEELERSEWIVRPGSP